MPFPLTKTFVSSANSIGNRITDTLANHSHKLKPVVVLK